MYIFLEVLSWYVAQTGLKFLESNNAPTFKIAGAAHACYHVLQLYFVCGIYVYMCIWVHECVHLHIFMEARGWYNASSSVTLYFICVCYICSYSNVHEVYVCGRGGLEARGWHCIPLLLSMFLFVCCFWDRASHWTWNWLASSRDLPFFTSIPTLLWPAIKWVMMIWSQFLIFVWPSPQSCSCTFRTLATVRRTGNSDGHCPK